MSSSDRIPFGEAVQAAFRFRELFAGCYERWEIAGSIRRRCQTIGDIEHVITPKYREGQRGLRGEPCGKAPNLIRLRAAELIAASVVTLHRYGRTGQTRFGNRHIGLDFEGRMHELFMCDADNWGCILAIRTGSAEFSRVLVSRMRRHGYRQDEGALHRRRESSPGRGAFGTRIDETEYDVVPCPDEDTFFNAAGLSIHDWPPMARTDEAARRLWSE